MGSMPVQTNTNTWCTMGGKYMLQRQYTVGHKYITVVNVSPLVRAASEEKKNPTNAEPCWH